jgi:P4 family phage/plasmid primase-like protien
MMGSGYNRGQFCSYMSRYAVSKGMEFTHTSIIKPSGSFYVSPDDWDDFISKYRLAMRHGEDLHMTEKHREVSPVLIDLDFRFDKEKSAARQYTPDMVEAIIGTYVQALLDHLECPPQFEVFVMEKPAPVCDKKLMKDGIHIVIPEIVTPPAVQLMIRKYVMPRLKDALASLELQNSIEDVVDEAVIERNNWQMYGSKKPNCEPYKVTKIYKVDSETQDRTPCPLPNDDTELVERLAIRNKYDETPVKTEKQSALAKFVESRKKSRIDMSKPIFRVNLAKNECENVEWIEKLVDILDPKRADKYDDWIRVGWCLRNIDHRLLNKWIQFSQKSEKYTEGECERFWNMMRDDGLGLGTLCMWVRQDNPDAFYQMMEQDLNALLMASKTETHYDIAKVVHFMFRYDYVCVSIKNNSWYEFKNHRWVYCDAAYSLRQKISQDVFRKYMMSAANQQQKGAVELDEHRQSAYAKDAKKLTEISLKLKQSPFKDNIIKECRELFYVDKFDEKLDSKCHLIGFSNGVYDMEAMEFREGHPEDYISMSTHINYIPFDRACEYQLHIDKFMSTIFPKPHIKEYILKLMGTFLNGSVREEKFHIWTGTGCHAIDTQIMMANGSVKLVQDVCVGDLLMGDDSTPRTVLQLFRGNDEMYKITPDFGEGFVVNGNHVLSLRCKSMTRVYFDTIGNAWVAEWGEHDAEGVIVRKRLAFDSETEARNHKPRREVQDGDVVDVTVHEYLRHVDRIGKGILALYKAKLQFDETPVNDDPSRVGNLIGSGVLNCDGIPDCYKYNSIKVREAVLSGIIATSGHNIEFRPWDTTSKGDIAWLARSVGRWCHESSQNCIEIGKNAKDMDFDVCAVGKGEFYGFELDGNHRYLMSDFTVTHNSNGKSVLIDLFERTFGDYCCKFPVTLLTMKRAISNAPTPEIARSKGRRFAVLQEPSEDEKMNVGLMKELTGGDKIMARQLHKEPIEFKPQFKMVLTCNHLPNVPSDDGGTWRRIRVVEFTSKFCENPNPDNSVEFMIDKDLTKKFDDWKEHFMALLLQYYAKYTNEGLQEPDEVMRCTRDYQRSNDIMMDFMEQELEKFPGDDRSHASLTEIFARFQIWIKDNAPQMKNAINKKTLKIALEKGLGKLARSNGVEVFKECKLRSNGITYGDDALDGA